MGKKVTEKASAEATINTIRGNPRHNHIMAE